MGDDCKCVRVERTGSRSSSVNVGLGLSVDYNNTQQYRVGGGSGGEGRS